MFTMSVQTTFIFFNTHTHMHFRRYANEFFFSPTPWKLLKSLQQDWLPPPTVSAPLQTKQTETKGSTSHLERNFNNEPVLLQNWRKGESEIEHQLTSQKLFQLFLALWIQYLKLYALWYLKTGTFVTRLNSLRVFQ